MTTNPPEPSCARRRPPLDRARFAALATSVALVVFAEALARRHRALPEPAPPLDESASASATYAPDGVCPAGTLQDDAACIPVPAAANDSEPEHQRLALLPGRNPNPAAYQTPIAAAPARMAADGRGIFAPAPAGTPIRLIELEAQEGAGVVLRGDAGSNALVTLHRVRRARALRRYLLVYGGATAAPSPTQGSSELGVVEAPAAGASGLTLWVRQLRHGVDAAETPLTRLLEDSHSLACDPRNVLPSRDEP